MAIIVGTQNEFHAQLSWVWKSLHDLGAQAGQPNNGDRLEFLKRLVCNEG